MREIILSNADHILLLVMGVLLPIFAVFQSQPQLKGMTFNTNDKLQIYYGNSIFQWIGVGVILIVWWINNRAFPDLGFGIPQQSVLALGLVLLFTIAYCLDTWSELRNQEQIAKTRQKWLKDIPFLPENWLELKHFFFVAITAGFCEEVIFRGFFIQYFLAWNQDNLMGTWLAIIIPSCLFAFGHIYQGHLAVLKTLLMGILLGWIFVLTESLWIPIIIHFLVDIIGGYIAMCILRKEA